MEDFMSGIAFAAGGAAGSAPAAGGVAMMGQILPIILIFAVFYFLLIRPQQKKAKEHQAYLANLKRGDKVITSGGIYGQITGLTESAVTLEVAENVRIKVSRSSILGSALEAEKAAAAPEEKKG